MRDQVPQLTSIALELVEHRASGSRDSDGLLLALRSRCAPLDVFLFHEPKLVLQELEVIPRDAYLVSRASLIQEALAVQFLDVDSIVEEYGVFVLVGIVSIGPAVANSALLDIPCVLASLFVDGGAPEPG